MAGVTYISRGQLSESPRNIGEAHQAVWSLFGDRKGERPFVFMHEGGGRYLIYSSEEPVGGEFVVETKIFKPAFKVNQLVRFMTVLSPCQNRGKQRRTVVSMAREDGDVRPVADILLTWAGEKLGASGLEISAMHLEHYDTGPYTKYGKRAYPLARLSGVANVSSIDKLIESVGQGIGRGGAYGAGGLFLARAAAD
jgi:CRISPR system Cascade subunit CasE